jgi:hypothetical protein
MKNYRLIIAAFFFFLVFYAGSQDVMAQCAMCKATIEGNPDAQHIAKGLNMGILYLASIPYILFLVIGYYWYKSSRKAKKAAVSIQHKGN